jgi:hypothetical protein
MMFGVVEKSSTSQAGMRATSWQQQLPGGFVYAARRLVNNTREQRAAFLAQRAITWGGTVGKRVKMIRSPDPITL